MKEKIYKFFSGNVLVKGSMFILIGSVAGNIGTYLFHLFMGRLLGPEDYGVLESLISLIYFLGIPVGVLSLVIVRYVSSHKDNKNEISLFVVTLARKLALLGFWALLVFLALYPLINHIIKVNSFLLVLGVGIFSYFGIFFTVSSSIFQGLTEFLKLSLLGVFNTWSKLIFAVILVLLGLRVSGAIFSIVISGFLSILFGYFMLKKYFSFSFKGSVRLSESFVGIKNYVASVFVFNLSMTSIYTLDIILAKFFLSPFEAGQYAALSILGKIVYFASSPITSVMFPLISERHAKKEKITGIFLQSLLLVFAISLFVSFLYFLFPRFMIGIMFGKDYLVSSNHLGLFAVFISFYSLSMVIMNFFLSIAKTKIVFIALAASLLQALLIFFFHSSVLEIVKVNIFSVSLLFLVLMLLFLIKQKKWIFYQS